MDASPQGKLSVGTIVVPTQIQAASMRMFNRCLTTESFTPYNVKNKMIWNGCNFMHVAI
jgi:hypothetical protein